MPPRKGPRNVVKSGNAGNSSKSSTPGTATPPTDPTKPPPLFPLGYKTPVQLLNEKCQKAGWERPIVDSHRNRDSNPPSYGATVLLKKRRNKNAMDFDTVRFVPVPPIEQEDSALARHFGATYALFRFCNNLPMAMLLPPVIRPYWTTLSIEKQKAPPHRDWEWAEDPFAARKEVDSRQQQRKVQQQRQVEFKQTFKTNGGGNGGDDGAVRFTPRDAGREDDGRGRSSKMGGGWSGVPEVKMTVAQREIVEGVIRKMMTKYPSAIMEATRESEATPSTLPSGVNTPSLETDSIDAQLKGLGFRPAHVTSCINALIAAHGRLHRGTSSSTKDPLTLSLSYLSPVEAAIEWLLVHLPEDDLPPSYRSSAATDFVSGAAAGQGGQAQLVKGWLVDKLTRKAGFPRKAVDLVLENETRETVALDVLGRRLCGWEKDCDGWSVEEYGNGWEAEGDEEERAAMREEELTVLGSVLDDRLQRISADEFSIRIDSDMEDLKLHIIFSDASPYPSSRYPQHPPSFYLQSDTLPAYFRLHLHGEVLRAFRDPERPDLQSMLDSGVGGAVYAMLEILETALPLCLDNPPDIAAVTQYLVPKAPEVEPEEVRRKQAATNRYRGGRSQANRIGQAEMERHREAALRAPGWEKMLKVRQNLPAWSARQAILDSLDKSRVVVIVGETGSGKSTQTPSYILDHEIDQGRGGTANILVTQPRRVAAIGVATRVAEERMEDLDRAAQTVGYIIRGESRTNPRMAKITFCTTGVVLRRLASGGDADLADVSHVLVDEVHERSVDGDFLLLQLREVLKRNKKIKIVLMSATINQKQFIDYFNGAPAIEIPGRTHPVDDFYLEDYISKMRFTPEATRFKIKQTEDQKNSLGKWLDTLNLDPKSKQTMEALSVSNQIPYDLIGALVGYITSISPREDEGILVFMPGVAEIKSTIEAIRSRVSSVDILPLHANLSNAEQKRVFAKTPRRKVVVATNVAETSVTIEDIVYVIDSGKLKETQFDPDTSMSRLVETYTSQAASRQRRGRAGRTKPGFCYKLFSRRTENQFMAKFAIPEILRTPLESLFLQVKSMDQDLDVKDYLSKALDPPKIEAMDAAWKTLMDLGAVEGEEATSHLTALGRHMSALPVDLRLAKMLVLACIFRALDPIASIAAILSSKPLFSSPVDKREEAKKMKSRFSRAQSDILLALSAYTQATQIHSTSGMSAMRSFCEEHFINFSAMRDISSLKGDFLAALGEIGLIDPPGRSYGRRNGGGDDDPLREWNINAENDNLLKSILVGAFWPRVVRIRLPEAKFEKVEAGSVAKDHQAKEIKFYDSVDNSRVFIHPGSMLFSEHNLKPGYITYFHKAETTKVYLFDATPVPLFSLLLFGGPLSINHFAGGITIGKEGHIRLKCWSRIGILSNQLRRLLDARLGEVIESVESGEGEGMEVMGKDDEVVEAMLALLT